MKNSDEQVKHALSSFPWLRAGFCLLILGGLLLALTGGLSSILRELRLFIRPPEIVTPIVEAPVEEEAPPSKPPEPEVIILPAPTSVQNVRSVKDLSNGIRYETKVNIQDGKRAAVERKDKDSYRAVYELSVNMPVAAKTLDELEDSNPHLGEILPGLSELLDSVAVSPFFETLYENKKKRVQRDAGEFKKLLTRHNFFDCETMLELKQPENGQRMMLIQGDMDVVSDGSDGDRLAEMPDRIVNSTHYQPFTSYGWPKKTNRPNPMIAGWKKRIENADAELALSSTKAPRARWLRDRKKMLRRGIQDMEARSFLIADYDPFIVLPVNHLVSRRSKFAGKVGDYAVVIYKDRVLPAIVGDGGPTFKIGEASLRMAKELNPRASSYSRPVSDLAVTYLVFCGSAGPKAPPNYELWRNRCQELLESIGGLGEGYELFEWEDTLSKEEEAAEEQTPESSVEE